MSNPSDPTGKPPADENVVRKRATDPRLRAIPSGEGRPVEDDLPPPPRRQMSKSGLNVVRVQEAVEITGNQQRPGFPPARVPTTPPPPRMSSSPPSPSPPPLVDLDSILTSGAPPPPLVMALDDLIGPASPPPPPALATGGFSRPAPPPPMAPRAAMALDPPGEPSRPRPAAVTGSMSRPSAAAPGLDPPVESSVPQRRPTGLMSLDPPVESSTQKKRPGTMSTGSFGRPSEPPPPPRVTTNAVLEAMGIAEEPPPPPPRWPPSWWPGVKMVLAPVAGLVTVLVAVVGLAVATLADTAGPATFTAAEQQRLVSLWLKHGAWGPARSDEVVGAVAEVGSTVVVPLLGRLGQRTVRFVVLKDADRARAAALPDGTIVISTGALRRLDNEAQLAALLAHTLAHLALGDVTTALESHPTGSEAKDALATSNPHKSVFLLDAIAEATLGNEKQAMELALEALKGAGWSAAAMAEMAQRLGAHDGLGSTPWHSVHPVDAALQHTLSQADKSGRTNIPEYGTRVLDRVGHLGPPPPVAAPAPTAAPMTAPPPATTTAPAPPPPPPRAPSVAPRRPAKAPAASTRE